MKRIFLFFLLFFFISTGIAQTVISVKSDTHRRLIVGSAALPTKVILPVKFVFDDAGAGFDDRKISFYANKAKTDLIGEGTFGDEFGKVNGTSNYEITFNNDSVISPDILGLKRKVTTFYFQVDKDSALYGPFNLTFFTKYRPGFMYYDALKLKEINNKTGDSITALKKFILKYYGVTDSLTWKQNVYLAPFYKQLFERKNGTIQSGAGGASAFFGQVSNAAGGVNVTPYINAIADLMIKRAKEELTVSFFNRFKKFSDKNPEFQVLFPKTTHNLSNLLTYAYPQMLPALRNGFHEDLNQITYHLDDVLELPRYRELLSNFPEVRVAIRSIRLVHELENGSSNAADMLKDFAGLDEWKDTTASTEFKNTGNAIRLAKIFSESLREKMALNDTLWVSPKTVAALAKDSVLLKLYTGLLYQQCKNEKIAFVLKDEKPKLFSDLLSENKNTLFLIQNKVIEFTDLAHKVDVMFDDLRKKNKAGTVSADDAYNYINVSVDVLDYTFSIAKLFDQQLAADKYMVIVRQATNLYRDIYKKEYTQAVSDALDILSGVSSLITTDAVIKTNGAAVLTKRPASDPKNKQLRSMAQGEKPIKKDDLVISDDEKKLNDADVTRLVVAYQAGDSLKKMIRLIEKIKPYALFMANVTEAKSEADITAALENVILPVGSSSIKKNAVFNISIQSYLGARNSAPVGADKKSHNTTWNNRYGVTAPIGITFSTRIYGGGSASLFLPLLDIGAVVDYKLKNDSSAAGKSTPSTDGSYVIKLGQIISPGAYLVYGAHGNLPLALGVGFQYGPGLVNVSGAGSSVTNPYWTFRGFIAIDIPFFTLKNIRKTD